MTQVQGQYGPSDRDSSTDLFNYGKIEPAGFNMVWFIWDQITKRGQPVISFNFVIESLFILLDQLDTRQGVP